MLGVDDGIVNGNLDFADIMFLVGFIVFAIAAIVRVMVRPVPIAEVLIAIGLAALSLGWFVL